MINSEEQKKLSLLKIAQKRAAKHIGVSEAQLSRMVNRTAGHVPSRALLTYITMMEEFTVKKREKILKKLDLEVT